MVIALWYVRSIRSNRATKNADIPSIARPFQAARSLGFKSAQIEEDGSNQSDDKTDALREPVWLSQESTEGEPSLENNGNSQMTKQAIAQTLLDDTELREWTISSPVVLQKAFPQYSQYAALVQKAESLPDVVMIPFENVVADDKLQGWEYEWVSDAAFDVKKWGQLKEPKIDFLYTCSYTYALLNASNHILTICIQGSMARKRHSKRPSVHTR